MLGESRNPPPTTVKLDPLEGNAAKVNLPDGEMFWGVRADSLGSTGRADLETSKRRDADQRKH